MKRERWVRYPQKRDTPTECRDWIYGRRPVLEVLKAGRRHLYEAVLPPAGRDAPEIAEMRDLLLARGVPFRTLERSELDESCEGGNHQGVAVRTGGYPYISFDQVLDDVKTDTNAVVLILDHIEDPQNVGSLLRTADAAGVTAVLIPKDRAADVTPAAVRASAGASEHLRVVKVVNLVRAMKELQACEVWITGLDFGPDAKPYTSIDFKGRAGLVVGSEGRGLSRLVRETCDFIASLPMKGRVESLNAGVAGAIALYEVV
ncbi:MAG TPA: 23S rRNA (guanosine(2251)-2'-O)-methyltransferase RlmB, partial [Kiritimatiellia bacterium]|nr:23S rRNA (guanosine(2251)-2'-O)-methyltransferase RlmB [Kiritimatiellia bacterium]HPK37014.1 23S rRNA (guanosine(2251)-2'-O)-methyltransferase RlmB [Kiritimatiellia bacterium]HPW75200.1 23S rRNA (guanosine(2251)-2'-O)-methyltransferase RlmB [Kiritimatiellia bacterium]